MSTLLQLFDLEQCSAGWLNGEDEQAQVAANVHHQFIRNLDEDQPYSFRTLVSSSNVILFCSAASLPRVSAA
jgi:hypothetical protein